MRRLPPQVVQALDRREDDWVELAREISQPLTQDKERQLRNLQSMAEGTDSWRAFALFLRYQAARGELDTQWAEAAVAKLEALAPPAGEVVGGGPDLPKQVHLERVARVLGYAVRWHVWDLKKKKEAGT